MKKIKTVAAACLCAFVLAGCGQANEQQTRITQDTVSSPDLVTKSIESINSNGQTYAYKWDAQDVDETMKQLEENIKSSYASSEAVSGGISEGELEALLKSERERLQAEHDLSTAVSAQPAANIMGTIMQELYGFEFSDMEIVLQCIQSDSDMFYHIDGGAAMRTIWQGVCTIDEGERNFVRADVGIDAFTGEIISAACVLDDARYMAARQTQLPECITYRHFYPMFDEDNPSFTQTINTAEESIKNLASGSLLLSGAEIKEISYEISDTGLRFTAKTDNGNEGLFKWDYVFPNYSFDGYPMRAYSYYNLSYLKK